VNANERSPPSFLKIKVFAFQLPGKDFHPATKAADYNLESPHLGRILSLFGTGFQW
jgi:hypothetical protein